MPRDAGTVTGSSNVSQNVFPHLRRSGYDPALSNSYKTKPIASAKIKTDKIDARTLAELLGANLVPACYVPSDTMAEFRGLTRHRKYLAGLRTGLKNKIHAILLMRGVKTRYAEFTAKHMRELRLLGVYGINSYLDMMRVVDGEILRADKNVATTVRDEAEANAKLLATMPGTGYYSALVIAAEAGGVSRFPDSNHPCPYAGLVPSAHSSGGRIRYGSKAGQQVPPVCPVRMRAVPQKNAQKQQRVPVPRKIARKKGNPKATVAAASKLLRVCYWLLKERREYVDDITENGPPPRVTVESGHG